VDWHSPNIEIPGVVCGKDRTFPSEGGSRASTTRPSGTQKIAVAIAVAVAVAIAIAIAVAVAVARSVRG